MKKDNIENLFYYMEKVGGIDVFMGSVEGFFEMVMCKRWKDQHRNSSITKKITDFQICFVKSTFLNKFGWLTFNFLNVLKCFVREFMKYEVMFLVESFYFSIPGKDAYIGKEIIETVREVDSFYRAKREARLLEQEVAPVEEVKPARARRRI